MARRSFPRLKGFRDFAPEDILAREHIFRAWRSVARRYGFQEYDGPPLESLDLYVEKSGEEIVNQLYAFKDKGGRPVALRPEMTPSLARILAGRSRSMAKPIRWFSIPQLFRYERQQRGRLREHFQWNVDIVGEPGLGADAEVIAVAIDGLQELGLAHGDFRVRISDRRLLSAVLKAFGVVPGPATVQAYGIIDKIERRPIDASCADFVERVGLSATAAGGLIDLLRVNDPVSAARDVLGHAEGAKDDLLPLSGCLARLKAMGLRDFIRADLSIVRGLDYYTGIVFEVFALSDDLRAISGGGRYDRLLEVVGGEPLTAVGFGMGDVVLGEVLKAHGFEACPSQGVDYAVIHVPHAAHGRHSEGAPVPPDGDRWSQPRYSALALAGALRRAGKSVTYALRDLGAAKQMKAAERANARVALTVGPQELTDATVKARDMRSGDTLTLERALVVRIAADVGPEEFLAVARSAANPTA